MINRQKSLAYIVGLILGLVILIALGIQDKHTRIIACDVGQGEAILLIKGSNQVLIDGGPSSDKVLSCLAEQLPFWDRTIELIVLTNSDFDHMNGLAAVIERYNTIQFVTADGVHGSEALRRMIKVLTEQQVRVGGVEQGENIKVGKREPITLKVLWPPKLEREYIAVYSNQITEAKREQILGASAKRGDLNERSVVLEWDENDYKVLLMGDAGDQAEKQLVEQNILQDIDLLKVGHHGSKYASSAEFLAKVRPEIAIISVGAKNRYGHPTEETIKRLRDVGAKIIRTDTVGTIQIKL